MFFTLRFYTRPSSVSAFEIEGCVTFNIIKLQTNHNQFFTILVSVTLPFCHMATSLALCIRTLALKYPGLMVIL